MQTNKPSGVPRKTLNALLGSWPKGAVVVTPWLQEHGVSDQLAMAYVRSNWMKRLGSGAYVRPADPFDWRGGLFALQQLLGTPVHVGAKTALELQGLGHFVPFRETRVQLFGAPGLRLPPWFKRRDWGPKILYTATNLFGTKSTLGFTEKRFGELSLRLSAPERALIELARQVPRDHGFQEARLLMESRMTLRPKVVQELLENCRSIKAKRLFLFLAQECDHPWLKRLDLSKIGLGRGKRVIEKGGFLDSRYQIVVPRRESEGAAPDTGGPAA